MLPGEMGQLHDLAEACRADGYWDFFLTATALRSPAGAAPPSARSPSADPAADRRVTVDGSSFET
ncbi:hypothetical protein ADK47_30405 [Streptomyces rimosus subsp. rimosus]|uniref:Uncharacterized protein n=1 Tax=Streptomyces rimosus subsp. rimosus TaxID=132474 RepID=A0ABY3ZE04_STRRM|nr:hypothetical protein ADK78_30965 [Kitasatospora aureofaciens]KOT30718.1 hypothetical protein ADK84_31615 [Streptomyces sp. NRRL WC-3701]KOT55468.1 hypothetical protein ADK45_28735 [Streptomyces rimosus subsp. rimosus]QDA09147.1 hypothetical protein CTZ40_40880 [Streptomyces rimosus]KOT71901.1 hypothetical protein ADK47_30405 [Streptomyces rimosus subsp. rimosus]